MLTLAFSVSHQTTLRLLELAGAATAVAGGLIFLGAGSSRPRGGQAVGGILLAAAGVLTVVAIRWGSLT